MMSINEHEIEFIAAAQFLNVTRPTIEMQTKLATDLRQLCIDHVSNLFSTVGVVLFTDVNRHEFAFGSKFGKRLQ